MKRYLVSGKVQGVFFRASTRAEAEALGLQGYAINKADGSVEVLAVGEQVAVEKLPDRLHDGPPLAKVLAALQPTFPPMQ